MQNGTPALQLMMSLLNDKFWNERVIEECLAGCDDRFHPVHLQRRSILVPFITKSSACSPGWSSNMKDKIMPRRFADSSSIRLSPSQQTSAALSRRNALRAVAAAATGILLTDDLTSAATSPSWQPAATSGNNSIPIIDTHQHLWDLRQLRTPWLDDAPELLRQKFHNEEYARATQGLPLKHAIYMEIDVHPDDQQKEADLLLQQIADGSTPTMAAIISGRPNDSAFEAYISALATHSGIKGARQVLHPPATERGLCLQPQFVKSMQLLGQLNLSFDLCMRPAEVSDAVKLAKLCPETQFILDHCGNAQPSAFQTTAAADEKPSHSAAQWKRDIEQLAACPNVACKISGVIASVLKGQDPVEMLSPIVNHCLDSFGPDRVVFGGDWPVCLLGGSFKDWVATLQTIIKDRPVGDQEKLWHKNAMTIYRLG